MEVATLITYLQLFGIGLTFGIAGPCLFFCTPVIAAYVAASQKEMPQALGRIAIFFAGRIVAYAVLGYLAGLSGEILRGVVNSQYLPYLRLAGGVGGIILGLIVLSGKREDAGLCGKKTGQARSAAGLIVFGFLIGGAPCAPLMALLAEIALISRGAFQGALYAVSFGAGTFLSGFITAGAMAGIIGLVPARFLKSEKARFVFRVSCALFLILFGSVVAWQSFR
ncbi:MAG: sulfite exporter TauE/SafE family protein [Candidatus Omnitrophota bacterium]